MLLLETDFDNVKAVQFAVIKKQHNLVNFGDIAKNVPHL